MTRTNGSKLAWAIVSICIAGAACGKSGGDIRSKWLKAKLVPTTAEVKGVKFHVDLPEGLPENKESLVGPDWTVPFGEAGPSVHVSLRDKAFKTPEELARDVEPDAKSRTPSAPILSRSASKRRAAADCSPCQARKETGTSTSRSGFRPTRRAVCRHRVTGMPVPTTRSRPRRRTRSCSAGSRRSATASRPAGELLRAPSRAPAETSRAAASVTVTPPAS